MSFCLISTDLWTVNASLESIQLSHWCNQKARSCSEMYKVTEATQFFRSSQHGIVSSASSGLRHGVSSSSSASRDRASVRSAFAHALMLALYTIASRRHGFSEAHTTTTASRSNHVKSNVRHNSEWQWYDIMANLTDWKPGNLDFAWSVQPGLEYYHHKPSLNHPSLGSCFVSKMHSVEPGTPEVAEVHMITWNTWSPVFFRVLANFPCNLVS